MDSRSAGIVLAGGRSRRMHTNKALLRFGPHTLLARVVERVRAACSPVLVVAGRPQAYPHCGAPVIPDRYPGAGPLAGLHAGLGAVRTEHAAVVACDLPFVEPALLRGLLARTTACDAAVPVVGGRPQPLCAVYHRGVAEVAEELLRRGARSMQALLERLHVLYVFEGELRAWDPDLRSFFNVNTPADYERALAML